MTNSRVPPSTDVGRVWRSGTAESAKHPPDQQEEASRYHDAHRDGDDSVTRSVQEIRRQNFDRSKYGRLRASRNPRPRRRSALSVLGCRNLRVLRSIVDWRVTGTANRVRRCEVPAREADCVSGGRMRVRPGQSRDCGGPGAVCKSLTLSVSCSVRRAGALSGGRLGRSFRFSSRRRATRRLG
jgi:hypothetical protein